jgi:hypothetical protein
MAEEFDMTSAMEELGATDVPPIDIESDFSYEVTGENIDGDNATVDYSISMNYPEPVMSDDGMSVTGWTASPTEQSDSMELTKEDGVWKACDTIE